MLCGILRFWMSSHLLTTVASRSALLLISGRIRVTTKGGEVSEDFEGTYTIPIFTDLARLARLGEVAAWFYAAAGVIAGIHWISAGGDVYLALPYFGAGISVATATVALTRYIRWALLHRSSHGA